MAGLSIERLRDYLRQLPPGSRAQLVAELERTASLGGEIPGGEALLEEVRSAVQGSEPTPPQARDPVELFFKAVEPFLIDDVPAHKHLGRIAHAAVAPIWSWICRDLAPGEAKIYCEEAGRALLAGVDLDRDEIGRHARFDPHEFPEFHAAD